ncbi:hypothetical protein KJA14_00930 [Patescibacteria group bacterium]|nr:hypothetical protein [Patescibacteria group bacterium]
MTKRTRTILFFTCLFLFLSIAPLVVFYSMGYRFDFDSKKIVQTGGFYFKVWPKSVRIYLDGELKKTTDFFFGSAFIENLLPRKYEIQIQKEGHHLWKKTLEIKEKQVTEAKNIILIPKNPSFTILGKEVEDFFFSPDREKIVLKEEEALKLFEIERNIKSYLIKDISDQNFKELFFSADSKKILLKFETEHASEDILLSVEYQLLELDKRPFSPIRLDFLDSEIKEIFFNPKDSSKIFFLKNGELFEGDLEKEEISSLLLKDILAYQILEENIYYLDNSGFIFKTDFSFKFKEKINAVAFPIKNETDYQLSILKNFIFLQENKNLYLFNSDSKSFEKFFEPVKSLKISPDYKKIVYFSDYEIWILFLEDVFDQPWKKAKEKVFLTRFSEKIEDCFWYTSHYLIFNTVSKTKIAEIDDRDRINIYDLIEFKDSKIFFNENGKKIYVLSGGNFFVSEKLLP